MRISAINIGDFDMRVTFYTQNRGSVDVIGNPTLDLGTGVVRWANVNFKNETIKVGEGGLQYQNVFIIKVRLEDITVGVGDRVDFDGQALQIVSVDKVDLVTYEIIAQGIE